LRDVIVDDLEQTFPGEECEISARVRRKEGDPVRLWFRFPEEFAPARVDGSPFLAATLLKAMRDGDDLTIDAPVSFQLLGRVDELMGVYRSFIPRLERSIEVRAPAEEPPPPNQLTGSFFSRGVDSWYAVLTALEDDPQIPPLSHLVFCPGFLPSSWGEEMVQAQIEATREAVEATGCRFIIADTNQRRDMPGGHRLGAMSLAVGFQRMLIPSGGMRGELRPRNTHPEIDPRYSTERTRVVHYGDASRMQKVARMAHSDDSMRFVQVCREDDARVVGNCDRCEKCLRTMLQFRAAGALQRAPAFADRVDPGNLVAISKKIKHPRQWVDILHSLGDGPEDRELRAAVRLVIARGWLYDVESQLGPVEHDQELARLREDLPEVLGDVRRVTQLLHRSLDVEPDNPDRERLRHARRLLDPESDGAGRPPGRLRRLLVRP
jgi:hypothetical protein